MQKLCRPQWVDGAGVVDQDVERPRADFDIADQGLGQVEIGQVPGKAGRFAIDRLDFEDGLRELVFGP